MICALWISKVNNLYSHTVSGTFYILLPTDQQTASLLSADHLKPSVEPLRFVL